MYYLNDDEYDDYNMMQYVNLHNAYGPIKDETSGQDEWWLYGTCYAFNDWIRHTPIRDELKIMLKLQYA